MPVQNRPRPVFQLLLVVDWRRIISTSPPYSRSMREQICHLSLAQYILDQGQTKSGLTANESILDILFQWSKQIAAKTLTSIDRTFEFVRLVDTVNSKI